MIWYGVENREEEATLKDFKDMNAKERKAYKNIDNAAIDHIYGLENGCFDTDKGSEEYNGYYEQLNDLEGLIEYVYNEAISAVYEKGCTYGGAAAQAYIKDIRFCGKEFLMEVTRYFCEKYQAEVLADLR